MADSSSASTVCGNQGEGLSKHSTVSMVAVDGSEQSYEALGWYVKNIRKPGSKMIVVHCSDYRDLMWAPVMSTDSAAISNMVQHCEDTTSSILSQIQKRLASFKVEAQLLRLSGDPGPAIVKAAKEHQVDFIVTGTRVEAKQLPICMVIHSASGAADQILADVATKEAAQYVGSKHLLLSRPSDKDEKS